MARIYHCKCVQKGMDHFVIVGIFRISGKVMVISLALIVPEVYSAGDLSMKIVGYL